MPTAAPGVAELLSQSLSDDRGEPLTIFRTMAHHPALLAHWNQFTEFLLTSGVVAPRLREIVTLRTAWRTGCRYVWAQHVLIGRAAGLTDDEIAALAGPRRSFAPETALGVTETNLLVRLVDDIVEWDDVTDATWDALAERYPTDHLIELTVVVGLYRMAAGFLNSTGVQPDADAPGWPHEPTWTAGRERVAAAFPGRG